MIILTSPFNSRFIHLWKIYFFTMYMHWTANLPLHSSCEELMLCNSYVPWAPPISYCILPVENRFFSMCDSIMNWKIWSEAAWYRTFSKISNSWELKRKAHLNVHPWSHRSPQYSPSAFVAGGRWWPQPPMWHMRQQGLVAMWFLPGAENKCASES